MQTKGVFLLPSLIISLLCSKRLLAANLVWSGTNGTIWDTNSTINWFNAVQ